MNEWMNEYREEGTNDERKEWRKERGKEGKKQIVSNIIGNIGYIPRHLCNAIFGSDAQSHCRPDIVRNCCGFYVIDIFKICLKKLPQSLTYIFPNLPDD